MLLRPLKNLAKRSALLRKWYAKIMWRLHIFKDWWGTKVWTKTQETITPLGFKLISGLHPAYKLMRAGKFEPDETVIISRLLLRVDRFVDIGANLGYYTLLALQKGKPVIAFEPQQQNLQCLFKNIMVNGWGENKVEIFPVALSERPGLLTLYGASGPSASLIKNWAGYSEKFHKIVPVSTLDNVLAGRFHGERLLIKIDVEGAEYHVLKGAQTILAMSPKPLWLLEICLDEFHPGGSNPDFERIFNMFFEHGYQAYTATADLNPVNRSDISEWVTKGHAAPATFNYLFAESAQLLFE
ncbi:MAG: FkbM family methyltransferase [Methylobacillus sp.]|jgi:FkbM family methyltransferase|nr:FkbM family methyltransferase [Methylobacillus sp.]